MVEGRDLRWAVPTKIGSDRAVSGDSLALLSTDGEDEEDGSAASPPPAGLRIPDSVVKGRAKLEEAITDAARFLNGHKGGGKDLKRLIRVLKSSSTTAGHPAIAEYYIGMLYMSDENYRLARKYLSKALRLDSESYEVLAGLGDLERKEQNLDEAMKCYDGALGRFSNYEPALWAKADLLVLLGNLKDADDVFAKLEHVSANQELSEIRAYIGRAIQGPAWEHEYIAETDSYRVRTGVSQEIADEVAGCAEQVRKLYGKFFMDIPHIGRKYEIIVYRSKEEYMANGGPRGAGGHYSPFIRTLNLFEYKEKADMMMVLYHEGFHQYLHEYLGTIPQWFNEGLGDFFGGGLITPDGRKAMIGPNPWRVDYIKQAMRAGVCPSAEELMNMSRETMYGKNVGVHYAQAWAIVYFCMKGGKSKYSSALKKYFTALRKGLDQQMAYRSTFARLDMVQFERDWRSFISKCPTRKEVNELRKQLYK